MNASEIARLLGGRRTSSGWSAHCPSHQDRTASFSISENLEGKVLFHCFAGCQRSDVIAALRDRGLWGKIQHEPHTQGSHSLVNKNPVNDDAWRVKPALSIWETAIPASGTLVERYLASRGLSLPPTADLRFHSRLKHSSGFFLPAMVALVCGPAGVPVGCHRTFLKPDGTGKADVVPQRMMLGPCRGGAVRLGITETEIMIGEGVETTISAMNSTGKVGWAALSASGLATLELPPTVQRIVILADGDEPGEAAAQDAGQRWCREGRHVRLARAPRGKDFNDVLIEHIAANEDSAS